MANRLRPGDQRSPPTGQGKPKLKQTVSFEQANKEGKGTGLFDEFEDADSVNPGRQSTTSVASLNSLDLAALGIVGASTTESFADDYSNTGASFPLKSSGSSSKIADSSTVLKPDSKAIQAFAEIPGAERKDVKPKPRACCITFKRPTFDSVFETIAFVFIVLNALWIGVEIDMNHDQDRQISKLMFERVEAGFCALFSLEMLLRFLRYHRKGKSLGFFQDPNLKMWNMFDLVIVVVMLIDTVLITYGTKYEPKELRPVSALRLLRVIRLMHLTPECRVLLKSINALLRSVASGLFLAFCVMYVTAIFLLQWVRSHGIESWNGDGPGPKDKCLGEYRSCDLWMQVSFGNLRKAFLSLLQILFFAEHFEILRPVFWESRVIGGLLVAFIIISVFLLGNIVIGVICFIISETRKSQEEEYLRLRMEAIFKAMGVDSEGIPQKAFQGQSTIAHLKDIGVNPEICRNAYDMLVSERGASFDPNEFIDLILRCLAPPRAKDVTNIETRLDRLAENLELVPRTSLTLRQRPVVAVIEQKPPDPKKIRRKKRRAEEREMLDRMRVLAQRVGDIQLWAEATNHDGAPVMPLTDLIPENLRPIYGSDTWLTLVVQSIQSTWDRSPTTRSLPRPEVLEILRPAFRTLQARMSQLRAECKANGMRFAGNIGSRLGEDLVPRENVEPMDKLIEEILRRLVSACSSLGLENFQFGPTPMTPKVQRQRPDAMTTGESMSMSTPLLSRGGMSNTFLSPPQLYDSSWTPRTSNSPSYFAAAI